MISLSYGIIIKIYIRDYSLIFIICARYLAYVILIFYLGEKAKVLRQLLLIIDA